MTNGKDVTLGAPGHFNIKRLQIFSVFIQNKHHNVIGTLKLCSLYMKW